MKITHCKTNHYVNPLGFQLGKEISFSWLVEESKGKHVLSTALKVFEEDNCLYDSGWTTLNARGTIVPLNLKPRTRYSWTVSVKTDAEEEETSKTNFFETGKMEETWCGKWISVSDTTETRHPIFKKQFHTEKPVKKARLYITGLGLYEAFLNDVRIGNELLTPYSNAYQEWIQVQTYDVTEQIQKDNEIAIHLGNGWYRGRFGFDQSTKPAYGEDWKCIAELHLTYEDGREDIVKTDNTWSVERSNIVFSNIYDGEQVDARLENKFEGNAIELEEDTSLLKDRLSPPVSKKEEFHPVLFTTPKGEKIFDLGQNLAGTFRLKVHEPEGTTIHLQFGEVLQDDCFYRDNLRTAKAEYIFVSDGKEHILEPHFTYYGYRYVKVEGISNLKEEDFTGYAIYTDMDMCGVIKTGNEKINRLFLNGLWGMKSNYVDVPTDCPQRDERMGWTGDTQVFSKTGMYLADCYAFFTKYLYDMYMEQKEYDGLVPFTVPAIHIYQAACVWGDSATIIPTNYYQMSGDLSILKKQYPSMKAWVSYIRKVDGDHHGWREAFHFGDWLALDGAKGPESVKGATDECFVADVYYRKSVLLVADAAKLLGYEEDEKEFRNLAKKIEEGIYEEFYTPSGRCAIETQTGQILSLIEGLGDSEHAKKKLLELLTMNLGKLATGFVGTPLLNIALSKNGYHDEAYNLLLNEEYPGWLYEVNLGATTIWERWNSIDENGYITGIGMNSLNHYSYGAILQWMFEWCGGLEPIEPGFHKAVIHPIVDERLNGLEMTYPSVSGTYEVKWSIVDDYHMHVEVTIPFDCTATLQLPFKKDSSIELDAGHYVYDYTTDELTTRKIQLKTSVKDALQNKKVKEYLETLPLFAQSEYSFGSSTVEQAVAASGITTAEQKAELQKKLLELQE